MALEFKTYIESLGCPKIGKIQIFNKYGVISECECGATLCLTTITIISICTILHLLYMSKQQRKK